MTVSLPERLQQLTSRMLRKRLFVVTMTADAGPPHERPRCEQHAAPGEFCHVFEMIGEMRSDGTPTGDGLSNI
jgi:hypothetical protein